MAPITDYFKSFTIPKNRIPRQDEDDEIVVAPSSSSRANTRERTLSPAKRPTQAPAERKNAQNGTSTVRRGRGRPRKDISTSPSKLRLQTPVLEEGESGRSTPTRRSPRKHTAGMGDLQNLPPDSSGLTSVRSSLKSTPTKVRVSRLWKYLLPRSVPVQKCLRPLDYLHQKRRIRSIPRFLLSPRSRAFLA